MKPEYFDYLPDVIRERLADLRAKRDSYFFTPAEDRIMSQVYALAIYAIEHIKAEEDRQPRPLNMSASFVRHQEEASRIGSLDLLNRLHRDTQEGSPSHRYLMKKQQELAIEKMRQSMFHDDKTWPVFNDATHTITVPALMPEDTEQMASNISAMARAIAEGSRLMQETAAARIALREKMGLPPEPVYFRGPLPEPENVIKPGEEINVRSGYWNLGGAVMTSGIAADLRSYQEIQDQADEEGEKPCE